MSAGILDLGCVIWKLNFPNRNGKLIDVVLGYGDPQKYFENPAYFGTVVGRSANRIDQGRFSGKVNRSN